VHAKIRRILCVSDFLFLRFVFLFRFRDFSLLIIKFNSCGKIAFWKLFFASYFAQT